MNELGAGLAVCVPSLLLGVAVSLWVAADDSMTVEKPGEGAQEATLQFFKIVDPH